MALPSTGAISLANVNVELGLSSTTTISLNQTSVRNLAGKASGTISMSDLRGKSAGGTFTPDGGTSSGSPLYIANTSDVSAVTATISCSATATWTYVRTTAIGAGSVNVANGASATSITFTVGIGTTDRQSIWSLTAVSGGTTRYYTIDLSTTGTGAVMTL